MSKKIKIFCGPANYDLSTLYFEEAEEYIVGVDTGIRPLIDANISMDLAIGDFDSLEEAYQTKLAKLNVKTIALEKEKNMTDLAFALDYLYNNMDYSTIEVYGGIGGRVDHFLANMNLVKRYDITFKDNFHHIYVLPKGKHQIHNYHKYISFFALEDCYELSLQGFKYDLNHYYLSTSDSLCVSNEGNGTVSFSKGKLLVVSAEDINYV